VTRLVIDASRKIASGFIGIVSLLFYSDPENLLPSRTRACLWATATTAPGKSPASTRALYQDAIRASRVVEKPKLSGSVAVIGPSPNATADGQSKIKIALAMCFIRTFGKMLAPIHARRAV
jgi:hypothetical protein